MIKPKTVVPDLKLDLINDTQWSLNSQRSDTFTMVVFYRGLHCPVCKKYLETLATKLDDFSQRGVHVIAISCDSEEKAKKTGKEWAIPLLPVGFELSVAKAQEWGLYISQGIKESEPDEFSEPALFLVRPDSTLYAASIQSMPFARPDMDAILKAIDFIIKEDYQARGGA